MKTNLVVTDPLAGQKVSILMTVAAGEGLPREKRPFLISVGVAGQMPISRSGTFGDVTDLIHEAWTAFGVQVEMNGKTAKTAVSQETIATEELIAETTVTSVDDADKLSVDELAINLLPPTISATKPIAPKPAISKLSLF